MKEMLQEYHFPKLAQLVGRASEPAHRHADRESKALRVAVEQAYERALIEARQAVKQEALAALKAARQRGFEEGLARGLERATQVIDALKRAIAEVDEMRNGLAKTLETFCVDLTLAIVSRLIEEEVVRAEFVNTLVRYGVEALAPHKPVRISLNPADISILGARLAALPVEADESVAPGHARVEAAELFVEGGIDQAFEQIRASILKTRARRNKGGRQR